jgi:hypothetical protein
MIGVATLLVSLTGYAQQRKDKWLVGGGFDFVSQTTTSSQTNMVNNSAIQTKNGFGSVSPRVGYFFADRWAVGLTPSISFSSRKDSSETSKGSGYNLAAFVRYYQPIGEKLAIFGELNGINFGAGTNRRNLTSSTQDRTDTYQSLNVGAMIRPGIVYFITPKIGLETSFGGFNLGYFSNSNKSKSEAGTLGQEIKQSGFAAGLNFGYQFNLAALFYLGK